MTQRRVPLVSMSEHVRDDGVLVRVSGRLDRRSAADLRTALHRLLVPSGPPVLLDLEEAVIGDATALGLLVEARRRAQRHGVDLRVVAADERSLRLLARIRMSGLVTASIRPVGAAGTETSALAGTA